MFEDMYAFETISLSKLYLCIIRLNGRKSQKLSLPINEISKFRDHCIRILLLFACIMVCNMQSVAADVMCDVVASTNIQTLSGYSQWSCTTLGVVSTAPCTAPVWSGLICSGSVVVSISLTNIGVSG